MKPIHIKESSVSYARRWIALWTCVIFLQTTLFASVPAQAAQPVPTPSDVLPLHFDSLQIPQDIGKVDDFFTGSSDFKVIIVQDAHAIPDAQRSIRKAILYFHQKYGVNLIALEGASAKLDARMLKSFPDKERLNRVLGEYFDQGELAGGTAAAISGIKAEDNSAAGSRLIFQGIEDWPVYEEALGLYLAAMGKEKNVLEAVKSQKSKVESQKKENYSPELLKIDQAISAFRGNSSDFMKTLEVLAAVKVPEKGSELELLLQEAKSEGADQTGAEVEVRRIAEKIKKLEVGSSPPKDGSALNVAEKLEDKKEFNQKYQAFQTGQLSAKAFALFLREFLAASPALYSRLKTQDPQLSASLTRLSGSEKRMRNIEGTKLFSDFEIYAQSVKESLFASDAVRELDREDRKLWLMTKLAKLELSYEDWEELNKGKGKREKGKGEKEKIEQNQELIESLSPLSFPLFPLFESHVAFYENALKRDDIFFTNLQRLLKVNDSRSTIHAPRRTALLVAGGFHAHGLCSLLKENGISYALVMPEIKNLPEQSHYRQHMQGNVSWKNYFEVKNGKVNLYNAFIRGTRDRLIGASRESWVVSHEKDQSNSPRPTPQDPRLLKTWRDQIIRDLADEGRIEKAGEYTRFIDELTGGGRDKAIQKRLAQVDQFLEDLKKLDAQGQFTAPNIVKLFPLATALSIVGGSQQPDAWMNLMAMSENRTLREGQPLSTAKSEVRHIEGETASRLDEQAQTVIKKALTELGLSDGVFARDPANVEKFIFDKTLDISAFLGQELSKKQKIEIAHLQNKYRIEKVMAEFAVDLKKLKLEAERGKGEFPSPEQQESKLGQLLSENDVRLDLEREVFEIPKQYDDTAQKAQDKLPEKLKEDLKKAMDAGLVVINQNPPYSNWGPEPGISESLFGHYAPNLSQVIFQGDFYIDDNEAAQIDVISLDHSASPFTKYQLMPGQRRLRFHVYVREGQVYLEIVDLVGSEDSRSSGSFYQSFYGVVKFFANGLQREVLLVGETAVLKGKKKSLGLTRINDEQSLIKKLWIETIQTIAPEKIKDLTARGITERENFRYYEASFKPETSTNVQGILPSNAGQDGLSSIFDDASQRNLLVAAARRVAYFSGLNLGEVLSKVLVASSLSGYDNQTLKLLVNSANKPELTTLAPTTNHNRWALLKELFAKSADQTRLEAFIVLAVSRTEGINERAIRDLVENSLNYGLQYALLIRKLSSDPKNLALIEQLVELGKRLPFIERGETHNLLFLKRLQNRLESTLPGNGAALSFGTVDQARLATEVASLAARHGLEESPFPAYLRAALKAGPEILNAFLASIPSDLIDALLSLKTQREQDGKQYDIPELILRRESQSLQSNEPLKSSLRASFQLPNLPVNAQVVIVNLMSQDNNFLSEIIRNDTIQPYVRLIALGHLAANPAATTLGNLADMAVLADELRGKMTDTSFNEAAADSGIAPSIMIQGQAIAANILRAQALGEMIIPPRVLRRVLAQAVLTGGILYAKSHPTSESVDSANADFKFGRGFADAMTLREMWTVAVHEGQHLFSEAIIRSFAKAQRGGNYDTVFAALDELLSNLAELAYLQQSQGKLSKQAFDWVMKLNSNFEDHEAGGNRYSPLEGHILSAKVLAEFGKLQNVEAVDFTALLVSVIKEVQQYGESHFNVGLDAENPEEKRVTLFTELLETALLSAVVSAAQPEAARSEVRAIERVTPETRTSDEEVAAPEAGGVLPLLGSSNWLKKHNKRMEDLNSVGLADVFYLDKSGQVQVSTGSIRDWISQEYMLMRVSKEKQDADIYTQGYIPVPFEVDSQGRKVPAIYNIVEGQAVRMDPREIETKLGLTAVVAPDETTLTVKGFVRNTDAKVARVFSLIGNFSIYFSKDSGVLLRTLGDLEGVDPFITESMAGDKETEEVSEYAQLLIQKLLREGKIAARPSLALEFKGVGSQFSGYQHARNEASQKYAAVENKFVLIVGDGGFKEGFGFAGWEESLGKDRQRTITQNGGELNDRILIAHKIVERSESTSASNIDGYISARFILGSNTTLRMDQVTRRTLLPLLKDKYTDTADEEVLVKRYLYGIAFRLGRDARAVLDSGFVMDSGGNSLDNYSAFGQIADSGTLNTKGNRNLYPLSLRNNLLVRIANTLKAESLIFGIQKTFDDAFSLNFLVRRDAHAEASTPITAVKRSEVRSTDPRSVVQFSPESDPLNVAKINEAYMELNKLYPRRSEMRQLPVDGAATTTQGAVTAIVGILNRYYSRVGADDAKLLKGNERVQLIKAARVMRSFVEAGTDVEGETLELLAALQGFISYRGRADTKQIAKTLLTNSLERMNTALQINGLAIEFHEREVDPFLISQVPQSEQSNRSEMRVAAGRMSKAGLIETMDQYQLIDKDEKDFLKSRKGQKALTAVRTQARSEGIWNTDHEIELIERILALLSQREIEAGDNALFDAVTSQTGKSTPDVTLEPGQRLLRNGEKHAYFYLLLSGAVEIKGIGISKAPTFLGESVLLGQAAGADVIAIEGEAQLIRFTNEELQPDLREAILADFSRKKESKRRRLIRRSMLQRLKDDRRSKQAQVAGQLSV